MLDAAYIRDHLDAVKANCRNRNVKNADPDRIVQLDDERKRLETDKQHLQQRQNEVAKSIPKEKEQDKRQALIAEGKDLKDAWRESKSNLSRWTATCTPR